MAAPTTTDGPFDCGDEPYMMHSGLQQKSWDYFRNKRTCSQALQIEAAWIYILSSKAEPYAQ